MSNGDKSKVEEFRDIHLGMWEDTLLEKHPRDEWTRKPTIKKDRRHDPKDIRSPSLIVTYYYPWGNVVLERATVDDPLFGKITAYAIQEIHPNVNGNDSRDKSKSRRKKR